MTLIYVHRGLAQKKRNEWIVLGSEWIYTRSGEIIKSLAIIEIITTTCPVERLLRSSTKDEACRNFF